MVTFLKIHALLCKVLTCNGHVSLKGTVPEIHLAVKPIGWTKLIPLIPPQENCQVAIYHGPHCPGYIKKLHLNVEFRIRGENSDM